jgi:dTDP-4-amino-4,6-dideoxygalactose transaminase
LLWCGTAVTDIPFLDLRRVNARWDGEINAAVASVLERGTYVAGPEVASFEDAFARYCGTRHCVAVGNGSDALRLLLQASGLSPGDEVLVPANTFIATIFAIVAAGLRPVLVEPDPLTFLMDPAHASRSITARTRAIMAVHLYGRCAGIEALAELADEHRVLLFEDAAQAHGASSGTTMAGAFGVAAGFSFYPTKNLGALGDGGAITTSRDDLARDLRALRDYGSDSKNVHRLSGSNSRLDELQAAVLRVKLRHLDEDNGRRRQIAATYLERVRNPRIVLPAAVAPQSHVWHLFVVRTRDREALRAHLDHGGIGTAVHYPVPPHHQRALASFRELPLPVAEELHREVLSLPLHPALTDAEVAQVVDALNAF